MPAHPIGIIIGASIVITGSAYGFKKFVYDPHLAPFLDHLIHQFNQYRENNNLYQPILVPVESPGHPTNRDENSSNRRDWNKGVDKDDQPILQGREMDLLFDSSRTISDDKEFPFPPGLATGAALRNDLNNDSTPTFGRSSSRRVSMRAMEENEIRRRFPPGSEDDSLTPVGPSKILGLDWDDQLPSNPKPLLPPALHCSLPLPPPPPPLVVETPTSTPITTVPLPTEDPLSSSIVSLGGRSDEFGRASMDSSRSDPLHNTNQGLRVGGPRGIDMDDTFSLTSSNTSSHPSARYRSTTGILPPEPNPWVSTSLSGSGIIVPSPNAVPLGINLPNRPDSPSSQSSSAFTITSSRPVSPSFSASSYGMSPQHHPIPLLNNPLPPIVLPQNYHSQQQPYHFGGAANGDAASRRSEVGSLGVMSFTSDDEGEDHDHADGMTDSESWVDAEIEERSDYGRRL